MKKQELRNEAQFVSAKRMLGRRILLGFAAAAAVGVAALGIWAGVRGLRGGWRAGTVQPPALTGSVVTEPGIADPAKPAETTEPAEPTEPEEPTEPPTEAQVEAESAAFAEELIRYFSVAPHVCEYCSEYAERNPYLKNASSAGYLDAWWTWRFAAPEDGGPRVDSFSVCVDDWDDGPVICCGPDGDVSVGLVCTVPHLRYVKPVIEALRPYYIAAGWKLEQKHRTVTASVEGYSFYAVRYAKIEEYADGPYRLYVNWCYPLGSEAWDVEQDYIFDLRTVRDMADTIIAMLPLLPEDGEKESDYFLRFPFRTDLRYNSCIFENSRRKISSIYFGDETTLADGNAVFREPSWFVINAQLRDAGEAEELYGYLLQQYYAWFGEVPEQTNEKERWASFTVGGQETVSVYLHHRAGSEIYWIQCYMRPAGAELIEKHS